MGRRIKLNQLMQHSIYLKHVIILYIVDNESNKLKNLNESTLESRIKKLELELNTSLKSTQ